MMDCLHYIPPRLLLPALLMLLAPCAAMAASITNLTDHAQVIEIQTSSGYSPRSIAPGSTLQLVGKVKIKLDNNEIYLDDNMEYAMWPGGVFGPQRKLKYNQFR